MERISIIDVKFVMQQNEAGISTLTTPIEKRVQQQHCKAQGKQEARNSEGVNYNSHQNNTAITGNMNSAKASYIKQLLYGKNVQYTIIKAADNEESNPNQKQNNREVYSGLNLDSKPIFHTNEIDQKLDPIEEQHNKTRTTIRRIEELASNCNENQTKISNLESIFENRMKFVRHISENPFYVNQNLSEPWKIVTKISERLLNEIAITVEKDMNFGEKRFIADFLQNEAQC
ncbi:uncharacterized protein LOC129618975 [Condylostylus longicornis]|uniref:uncharacterized protein LOC129618975 n=1 Tax=Condylostylus longicornis TaxID=2530218 RepID=UPI00244E26AE|nr:uncharacterized protein LOC129618975 [Condylostylus longicornis]